MFMAASIWVHLVKGGETFGQGRRGTVCCKTLDSHPLPGSQCEVGGWGEVLPPEEFWDPGL